MIDMIKNVLKFVLIAIVFFYISIGMNFFTMLLFQEGTVCGTIGIILDVLSVFTLGYFVWK